MENTDGLHKFPVSWGTGLTALLGGGNIIEIQQEKKTIKKKVSSSTHLKRLCRSPRRLSTIMADLPSSVTWAKLRTHLGRSPSGLILYIAINSGRMRPSTQKIQATMPGPPKGITGRLSPQWTNTSHKRNFR